MSQKRKLPEYCDPDYTKHIKNPKLIEKKSSSKLNLQERIEKAKRIIHEEFKKEIIIKEKDTIEIQNRIAITKKLLKKIRYAVATSYYNSKSIIDSTINIKNNIDDNEFNEQSKSIHPAIKKILISKQNDYDAILKNRPKREAAKTAKTTISEKLRSKKDEKRLQREAILNKKINNRTITETITTNSYLNERNDKNNEKKDDILKKIQNDDNKEEINQQFIIDIDKIPFEQIKSDKKGQIQVKHLISVGNTSKYIGNDNENDNVTHKWMVYIQNKTSISIEELLNKVRFFLHSSYKPHDVVEICKPPFQLTRRGWGEFPVRVQLFFKTEFKHKPIQIIHNLILDKTLSGYQTFGSETLVEVWLRSNEIPKSIETTLNNEDSNTSTEFLNNKIIKEEIEYEDTENDSNSDEEFNDIFDNLIKIENENLSKIYHECQKPTIQSDLSFMFQDDNHQIQNDANKKNGILSSESSSVTTTSKIKTPLSNENHTKDMKLCVNELNNCNSSISIIKNQKKTLKVIDNRGNVKYTYTVPQNQSLSSITLNVPNFYSKDGQVKKITLIKPNLEIKNEQQPIPQISIPSSTITTASATQKINVQQQQQQQQKLELSVKLIPNPNKVLPITQINGKYYYKPNASIPTSIIQTSLSNDQKVNESKLPSETITATSLRKQINISVFDPNFKPIKPFIINQTSRNRSNILNPKFIPPTIATRLNNQRIVSPLQQQPQQQQQQQQQQRPVVKPQISRLQTPTASTSSNKNQQIYMKSGKIFIYDSQQKCRKSEPTKPQISLLKSVNKNEIAKTEYYSSNFLIDHDYAAVLDSKTPIINEKTLLKDFSTSTNSRGFCIVPKTTVLSLNNQQCHNSPIGTSSKLDCKPNVDSLTIKKIVEFDYKNELIKKFHKIKFTEYKSAVKYILKKLPFINKLVDENSTYKMQFPFIVGNLDTYKNMILPKRRAVEWLYAKYILKIIKNHPSFIKNNDKIKSWSTKELILFARNHAYIPVIEIDNMDNFFSININNNGEYDENEYVKEIISKEIEKEKVFFCKTVSSPKKVHDWLEHVKLYIKNKNNQFSINKKINEDNDNIVIDVENDYDLKNKGKHVDDKLILKSDAKGNNMSIIDDLYTTDELKFIDETCETIGIQLKSDDINSDSCQSSFTRVIFAESLRLFIEDILRDAVSLKAPKHFSTNSSVTKSPIEVDYIKRVISTKPRFDFLTNKNLGKI